MSQKQNYNSGNRKPVLSGGQIVGREETPKKRGNLGYYYTKRPREGRRDKKRKTTDSTWDERSKYGISILMRFLDRSGRRPELDVEQQPNQAGEGIKVDVGKTTTDIDGKSTTTNFDGENTTTFSLTEVKDRKRESRFVRSTENLFLLDFKTIVKFDLYMFWVNLVKVGRCGRRVEYKRSDVHCKISSKRL